LSLLFEYENQAWSIAYDATVAEDMRTDSDRVEDVGGGRAEGDIVGLLIKLLCITRF
jgi:hypothetical protein